MRFCQHAGHQECNCARNKSYSAVIQLILNSILSKYVSLFSDKVNKHTSNKFASESTGITLTPVDSPVASSVGVAPTAYAVLSPCNDFKYSIYDVAWVICSDFSSLAPLLSFGLSFWMAL